ncbi:MAG: HD domain-containing protein [Candidatus Nanoarchaeia archaeon]
MNMSSHEYELNEEKEGLLPEAIIFAFNAHSGQYRKLSIHQYIIHPLRVSEIILKNFNHRKDLESLRLIAVLHDTIEDTWVNEQKIREKFGDFIADRIIELTEPAEGTKQERHKRYVEILETASDETKIVKLADILDNVILTNDDERWKNFLTKSQKTLEVLELKEKDDKFDKIKKELQKIIKEKLVRYEQGK